MKRLVLLLCLVLCAPAQAAEPPPKYSSNVIVKADIPKRRVYWQRLADRGPVWPERTVVHILEVRNCPHDLPTDAAGCYMGGGWIYMVKGYDRRDAPHFFWHELGHAYENLSLGNIEYATEAGIFRWLMPEAWANGGALYAHEWFAEMYLACANHTQPIRGNVPNLYGFRLRPDKVNAFCYWLWLRAVHLYS